MKNQPNNEQVNFFLKKICEDRNFEKSPRNVRLLKFLVKKAEEKMDVNEYIIGLELFEKNYNPESNDSKVRVYMYNLRKKLEEYYNTSGKDDELRFALKKGKYNLGFVFKPKESKTKPNQFLSQLQKALQKNVLTLFLSAIILVLSFIIISGKKEKVYLPNDCWESFFEKNTTNVCVVSDQLICHKWINGVKTPVILGEINSEAEFISYLNTHKSDSVQLAEYTLFSKMAPFSVKTLTEWFWTNGSRFSVRVESRFETDQLRDNNMIYIGQFKAMNASKALFLKSSKKFSIADKVDGFLLQKNGVEKKYEAHTNDGIRTEYAMVSYMKMESGKKALFFVSNNDIGIMATVNKFTKKYWLEEFYRKLPANIRYFNALFEVNGLDRTELDCKLVEFEKMP